MMNLFVSSVIFQALLLYSVNAQHAEPATDPSPESGLVVDPNAPYNLSNPLLPTDCGGSAAVRMRRTSVKMRRPSVKIFNGARPNLGAYPWMALLEYESPTGIETYCGGALINNRYVLTAAHCLSSGTLKNVRLGEDDTDTNPDCRQIDEETSICADKIITVAVEEQIEHENYPRASLNGWYDIALLRLSRNVSFTNYVQPICLPPDGSVGKVLHAAGWGLTENGTESNVMLQVAVPYVEKDVCKATYSTIGVTLNDSQICAGGRDGKDTCKGDSGGPLMNFNKSGKDTGKWFTVGITSFGKSCGLPGWPGVYTKVSDFVPWILSHLRP